LNGGVREIHRLSRPGIFDKEYKIAFVDPHHRYIEPTVTLDPAEEEVTFTTTNPYGRVDEWPFEDLTMQREWGESLLVRPQHTDRMLLRGFKDAWYRNENDFDEPLPRIQNVSTRVHDYPKAIQEIGTGPGGIVPFAKGVRVFGDLEGDEAELYRVNVKGAVHPTGTSVVGIETFGANPFYESRGLLPQILPTLVRRLPSLHPGLGPNPQIYSIDGFSVAGQKAFKGTPYDFNWDLAKRLGWNEEQTDWWNLETLDNDVY
jgi:hypothetical protein